MPFSNRDMLRHDTMLQALAYNMIHLIKQTITIYIVTVFLPICIILYALQIIICIVETISYNILYSTIINRMSNDGYECNIHGFLFNKLSNAIYTFTFSVIESSGTFLLFKSDKDIIKIEYDNINMVYYANFSRSDYVASISSKVFDFPVFGKVLKSGDLIHCVNILNISDDGIIHAIINNSGDINDCMFARCDDGYYMISSLSNRIFKLSSNECGLFDKALVKFVSNL